MWSGPPYCETNDLMNRIRKINFSPDDTLVDEEEKSTI